MNEGRVDIDIFVVDSTLFHFSFSSFFCSVRVAVTAAVRVPMTVLVKNRHHTGCVVCVCGVCVCGVCVSVGGQINRKQV